MFKQALLFRLCHFERYQAPRCKTPAGSRRSRDRAPCNTSCPDEPACPVRLARKGDPADIGADRDQCRPAHRRHGGGEVRTLAQGANFRAAQDLCQKPHILGIVLREPPAPHRPGCLSVRLDPAAILCRSPGPCRHRRNQAHVDCLRQETCANQTGPVRFRTYRHPFLPVAPRLEPTPCPRSDRGTSRKGRNLPKRSGFRQGRQRLPGLSLTVL